jgi:hypothetical protein
MANLVPLANSSLIKREKFSIVKSSKFLPPRIKSSAIVPTQQLTKPSDNSLARIEKGLIQIDIILKGSLSFAKKTSEKKRKGEEQKEFNERERSLEKNKPKAISGIKLPTPPKMGFLDWIKNFITQTILGFIAVRLIDYLPQILKILPVIVNVGDFFIDVGGKLLDGLVTFVDKSYELVDKTRQFTKDIGGEGLAQNFDKFTGALSKMLDVAIIAAISAASMGDDFGGPGRGRTTTGGSSGPYKYDQKRALIRKKYGDSFARLYDQEIAKGLNSEQARKNVLSRYVRKGRITPQRMTGSLGGTDAGSRVFGRGIERASQRLAIKGLTATFGKGGAKTVLRFVRPFTKRLPIIGGLLDFGLSVALGEPIGRAAFKAIGATLLGTIGAALGGPFAILTGLAGGVAGDWAGGALYDVFFGGKKPQGKTANAAGGGRPATRGGKLVSGPAKRTVKKKKAPRTLVVTPKKLKPGASVGGEKKIKEIYPEPKDKTKMNPFEFLKKTYDTLARSSGLGALSALAIKAVMGDKPSYADYKNAGSGINNWMNQSIASGTLAYAGGGEVKMESIVSGEDYSDVIARSLQDSVAPQIDRTIQDLMKQMMLKKEEVIPTTMPGVQQAPGAAPTGGTLTIEQLVGLAKGAGFSDDQAVIMAAIAMAESGGNSVAHNKKPPDNSYGLWQINMIGNLGPERLRQFGISSNEKLFDPVTNAKAAYLIKQSQGFNAWTVHKSGAYKNFLAQSQAARGAAPLRTSPVGGSGGKFGIVEYITGDKNHPNFDLRGHGLPSNYHDHIAFSSIVEKERAKNILKSAGIQIGSELRPGDPGYHGRNLAIDIPGAQWGGSGSIGEREFAGSRRVRQTLGIGNLSPYDDGGRVHGLTRAILGEKGPEFVIDADSTRAMEENFPGFLEVLNRAKYQEAINVLRSYASYEQPYGASEVVVIEKQVPVPMMMGGRGNSTTVIGIDNKRIDTSSLNVVG